MGCGDVLDWVNPLGKGGEFAVDPLGSSLGIKGPGTIATHPWDAGSAIKSDWSKFKHWMVPDMRRDRETMVNGATTSRRLIYGTCRVSGQIVYAESAGDQNQFLHLVVALGGHPVAGFGAVSLDDKPIADFGAKVQHELFDGTQTTACATLVAASAGLWTTDHKLLGVPYIYLRLEYDEALFPSGLPVVKVVVDGKKVYDPRTGLTGWNNNPILCARDYMLIPEDEGGMGCEAEEITDTLNITMANLCDELVVKNAAGTEYEKRYTCNGAVNIEGLPKTILTAILQSCGGTPVYSEGVWKLYAAGYIAPDVEPIDESWLNGGISFQLGSNKGERLNTVTGTYIDPDDHWATKGFPTVTSSAYIADDDGEELAQDLTLNFTTSPTTAQRLAKILIERSRRGMTLDYPCNLKAFRLAPFDCRKLNNSRLGFVEQIVRIEDWSFSPTGGVSLALRQEDQDIYSWVPGDVVEVTPPPLTNLPDPRLVYPPTNIVLTPRKYETNAGMSARVDLDITWDISGPGTPTYELQYKLTTDGTWSATIPAPTNACTIPGLAAGDYDVRIRATNSIGGTSAWVPATCYVPNTTDTVPNVTGLRLDGYDPNATEFTGRDVPAIWNYNAPPGSPVGGLVGRANSWFRYFKVEIYDGNDVLRRTEWLIHERYVYTYEANCQDGNGIPTRTVKIKAWIMAAWGDLSPVPAVLTVSNPNIAKLPTLALTGAVNLLSIGLPRPADVDFSGFRVHVSDTPGFTPDASNLVSDGPDTVVTLVDVPPGAKYVRAGGYDSFGPDGINYSDEFQATVDSLTVVPELLDSVQRVDFFVRDSILYFDAAVLTWDAGSIDRGDQTYTLSAGTLAAANASYIIATFTDGTPNTVALSKQAVGTGIPSLTADQAIIALTSDYTTPDGDYYCFVRQANSMSIEGALIRNLNASQVVAGTFAANRISTLNGATTINGAGIVLSDYGTTATWSGVSGTGKPADNATVGATWGSNLSGRPTNLASLTGAEDIENALLDPAIADAATRAAWGNITSIPARFGNAPAGAGLCITSSYMGYYNGSAWKTYTDSSGNFYLSGPGTHSLSWTGSALTIRGNLTADDIQSGGTITGSTIQTATSGQRVVIDSANQVMEFYGDDTWGGGVQLAAKLSLGSSVLGTLQVGGSNWWNVAIQGRSYAIGVWGIGNGNTSKGVVGECLGTGYSFYANGAAGSTDYGTFTGAHDGLILKDTQFVPGDIVVDTLIVDTRGISNAIAVNELSSAAQQPNVLGVIVWAKDMTDDNAPHVLQDMFSWQYAYQWAAINSLGEGQVNVCRDGGDILAGDYICSSDRPGKGMRQADNILRNYTVAKARENCFWVDGEDDIRQIACTYHCG